MAFLRKHQGIPAWLPGAAVAQRLVGGGFARSVATLVSGTAGGQAIQMAAAPILTRLYSAEEFGALAVYLSVFGVLLVVVSLQYESAVPIPADDETAANLAAAALLVTACVSILSTAAVWIGSASGLLERYGCYFGGAIWVLPTGVWGAGTCQVLTGWALRRNRYSRVAGTKLAQSSALVIAQLTMGVLRAGVLGLIVGEALGRVAGSGSLAIQAWRQDNSLIRAIRPRRMWAAAYRYRRFPIFSSGAGLVNTAGFVIPTLLIAAWHGHAVLGWFSLADRMLSAASWLVSNSVGQVFTIEAARLAHSDPRALPRLYRATLVRMLKLSVLPFALVLLLGGPLFAAVLGAQWREAGVYAQLMALSHLAKFVVWPVAPTLNVLERQTWQLWWDISRVVLTVASVGICHLLGCPARVMIAAYSLALFVAYIAHAAFTREAIARHVASAAHSTPRADPADEPEAALGTGADEISRPR